MEFTLKIDKKAQARINPGRCINCGECKRICPTDAMNEYQKNVSGLFMGGTADMIETSCSAGCPVGIIPQTVGAMIGQDQPAKAYQHIADRTPMPWITSRVCKGHCYSHCKLLNLGKAPLDMHALEKAAVKEGFKLEYDFTPPAYDKVAVIGGGPAGIMAAFELRKMGYRPVIFEKRDRLGGAMSWGIPDIRLDKKAMHKEIDSLIETGIEVRYNYALGENFSLDQIWSEDFAACLLATGMSETTNDTIAGAGSKGVFQAIDILKETNDGGYSDREKETAPAGFETMGSKIAVIGRGSLLCETATILAAMEKEVIALIEKKDMDDEMEENLKTLEKMGVECRVISRASQIISDPEGVKAIEIMDEDRATNLFCDGAVIAFGRKSDVENISKVETSPEGNIRIDSAFRTNKDRIYACGEVAGSGESVVNAMAQGRHAARAIDRDLRQTGEEEPKAEFYPASSGETIYPENIIEDRDFRAIGIPGETCVDDIVAVLRSAGIQEDMPVYFRNNGPEDIAGVKKVAVIGGGIAGISAAIALAKRGVKPTIFEKTARLGGGCRWLSTNRRFDRARMDLEMNKLQYAGIEVVCNTSAGIRPDLMTMMKEYDAILLTLGESMGAKPTIPGIEAKGTYDVVSLMTSLNNGKVPANLGGCVAVVGSDDISVDVARALKRVCEEVTLLTLCGKGKLQVETPAARLLSDEGIALITGVQVTEIKSKDGYVTGAECKVVETGASLGIYCDSVVFGEGRKPDLETLSLRNLYLDLDENGYVNVNSRLATNMRGVFALGDFNMGSIDAGRAGARAVENFLFGENESIVVDRFRPEEMATEHEKIPGKVGVIDQQQTAPTLSEEGERCVACGYHQVEETLCIGCGICQQSCPTGAIWMEGLKDRTDMEANK